MVDAQSKDGQLAFSVSIDDEEEADSLANSLRANGGEVTVTQPPAGFAPLLIPILVQGIVTVGGFVTVIAEWWQRRHKPGLLIHVDKKGRVTVKHIDTPGDHVLVIDPNGAVSDHNVGSLEELKAILSSAAGTAAGAIKPLIPGSGSGS